MSASSSSGAQPPPPTPSPEGAGAIVHSGKVWVWQAEKGSWHFLTIGGDAGEELSGLALMRKLELGKRAGFGSLKVEARIGESTWRTSVFPDKERGWLLPLNAAIRKAEDIAEGQRISVSLKVI